MKNTNKIVGIVSALVAAATFGMIPLFSLPLIESGMSEISVLFYRCLLSGTAIAGMCAVTSKSLKVSKNVLVRILGLSCIYTMTAVGLMYAYKYISSGVVTTIHFLYPIIVAFLMMVLYKEKISSKIMLAAFFTLAGVAMLSWSGDGFLNLTGIMLALATAFTYAFYIIALKQKGVRDTDSRVVIFYIMLFCTMIFGGLGLATTGINPVPNAGSWMNLFMLALLPTIVSNMALVKAIKYAGATTTSILGSAEPLVAVLFGVLVFSERLSALGIGGLVVIIGSVSYVILAESRKQEKLSIKAKYAEGSLPHAA